MSAGQRDRLVTIQRATIATDAIGQEVEEWGALGTEWAQVFYGRGVERRQAAAELGEQSATFQMLENSTTRAMVLKDRFTLDGDTWDIRGISPQTPRRGHIEFTAVRVL